MIEERGEAHIEPPVTELIMQALLVLAHSSIENNLRLEWKAVLNI